MLKVLLLISLLFIPGCSFAEGIFAEKIDLLKDLIPNRIGIKYMVTSDSYSIPALSIESVHSQSFNKIKTENDSGYYWTRNFSLPSIIIDAEGELGLGASIGLEIYNVEYQLGFYSILGKGQHEEDKGWRAYLGIELF